MLPTKRARGHDVTCARLHIGVFFIHHNLINPFGIRTMAAAAAPDQSITCWLCPREFSRSVVGTDLLLAHVNREHGAGLTVGCRWCDSQFQCQRDRTKHRLDLHTAECPVAHRAEVAQNPVTKPDTSKTCKCVAHGLVFPTTHHLIRHFNDVHAAGFGKWSALVCDRCGTRNISSLPAMSAHVCAHGRARL